MSLGNSNPLVRLVKPLMLRRADQPKMLRRFMCIEFRADSEIRDTDEW